MHAKRGRTRAFTAIDLNVKIVRALFNHQFLIRVHTEKISREIT